MAFLFRAGRAKQVPVLSLGPERHLMQLIYCKQITQIESPGGRPVWGRQWEGSQQTPRSGTGSGTEALVCIPSDALSCLPE